jgi:hypothetical protein
MPYSGTLFWCVICWIWRHHIHMLFFWNFFLTMWKVLGGVDLLIAVLRILISNKIFIGFMVTLLYGYVLHSGLQTLCFMPMTPWGWLLVFMCILPFWVLGSKLAYSKTFCCKCSGHCLLLGKVTSDALQLPIQKTSVTWHYCPIISFVQTDLSSILVPQNTLSWLSYELGSLYDHLFNNTHCLLFCCLRWLHPLL